MWLGGQQRTAALIRAIKQGLAHRGFSFIEVLSECPTIYGRHSLGIADPIENLEYLRKNSITRDQAATMSKDELIGKIVVGKFVDVQLPT